MKKHRYIKFLIRACFLLYISNIYSLTIDRVIVSSDANPTYLDFWPFVAKAWKKLGIKPTLALIAHDTIIVDETLGDVIRFEPIANIPTSLQAQVIRLLLPAFFEHETCLISDIDIIPLQKTYFLNSIKNIPENNFVVYRQYDKHTSTTYPMCYNAAKGSTFKELFGVNSIADIPAIITGWYNLGYGWNTDERILAEHVNSFDQTRAIKLHHDVQKRIDRSHWHYNSSKLKNNFYNNFYIDAHMIRPYHEHKQALDTFFKLVGI